MGYIQKMGIPHLYRLTKLAREKEKEKEYFGMYCAILPFMDKETFKMFDDWKMIFKQNHVQYDMRSKDEIMNELLSNQKGGEN